jgi:hypothetical protein
MIEKFQKSSKSVNKLFLIFFLFHRLTILEKPIFAASVFQCPFSECLRLLQNFKFDFIAIVIFVHYIIHLLEFIEIISFILL